MDINRYKLEGQIYTRKDVEEIAQALLDRWQGQKPEIGYVIGTGFAHFADEIEDAIRISYEDLPMNLFPDVKTPGHVSKMVIGKLGRKVVVCASGKVFLNDGAPAQITALTVRLFWLMGCQKLVYTNTVGAIDPGFKPGEFVLLHNHINLSGRNPLVGEDSEQWGGGFFDMTYPYDAEYIQIAKQVAREAGTPLHDAVYACVLGPSFETAAEIKMIEIMGANVVGMSTVPDVTAARQLGMRVVAIGFISNMAAGVQGAQLDNDDILSLAGRSYDQYATLMSGLFSRI
jgi:purine-nucleoside phosphorylase